MTRAPSDCLAALLPPAVVELLAREVEPDALLVACVEHVRQAAGCGEDRWHAGKRIIASTQGLPSLTAIVAYLAAAGLHRFGCRPLHELVSEVALAAEAEPAPVPAHEPPRRLRLEAAAERARFTERWFEPRQGGLRQRRQL